MCLFTRRISRDVYVKRQKTHSKAKEQVWSCYDLRYVHRCAPSSSSSHTGSLFHSKFEAEDLKGMQGIIHDHTKETRPYTLPLSRGRVGRGRAQPTDMAHSRVAGPRLKISNQPIISETRTGIPKSVAP